MRAGAEGAEDVAPAAEQQKEALGFGRGRGDRVQERDILH